MTPLVGEEGPRHGYANLSIDTQFPAMVAAMLLRRGEYGGASSSAAVSG